MINRSLEAMQVEHMKKVGARMLCPLEHLQEEVIEYIVAPMGHCYCGDRI